MKKKNYWLILFSLFASVTSCDKNGIQEPECNVATPNRIQANPLPENSVISYVKDVYESLFPEEYERNSIGNVQPDVEYFTDSVLKMVYNWHEYENNDTILRILNFGSDKGYAVCSDLGIIAISPKGHLPLSDCTARATDEWISANMPHYYITTLVDQYALLRRTNDLFARNEPDGWRDFATGDPYVVDTVGPLVPVHFCQSYPYNEYCPDGVTYGPCATSNGKVPAGCCAIAIAQVFASKKYPSEMHEIEGNWDNIIFDCNNDPNIFTNSINILAKWIRCIGDDVNMAYSICGSAQAVTNNVIRCMSQYNRYSHLSYSTVELNDTTYLPYIDHGNALIMRGDVANGDLTQGHYWNVDGYCTIGVDVSRIIYATGEIVDRGTRTYKLAHCNWGWGNTDDGYFMFGNFDFCSYIDLNEFNEILERHDPRMTSGDRYNRNLQLITYDFNQ